MLTDTMMVASLDPVGKTVSMVSIPRDMVDAPLPKGGKFSAKINGLVAYVLHHPNEFPGYNGKGQAVLAYSLGRMLGVHIDYYAQVDLGGFVQAVDAVHGIDVNVDHAMCDAAYDEYGFENGGYSIGAGRHHMNGNQALGLCPDPQVARRERLHPRRPPAAGRRRAQGQDRPGRVPRRPARAAQGGRRTRSRRTSRRRSSATLAPLASDISSKDIYRAVVGHPLVRSGFDYRGSIQLPDFDEDRRARREDVHAGRDAPARPLRVEGADERGQGPGPARAEVLHGAQAQAEAEADPEADAQAEAEHADSDPDARRRRHARPSRPRRRRSRSDRGRSRLARRMPGSTRPPLVPCARSLQPVP